MKINEYLNLKNNLEQEFGEETLDKITNEVTSILKKYQIDATPSIQKDIFDYIRLSISISRI